MRIDEKEILKKVDKENRRNKLLELEEKIKIGIFGLFYLLLKNQNKNIWIEIVYIIVVLIQLISFSFDEMVNIIYLNYYISLVIFGKKIKYFSK
jgi:hypothetical protein